MCTLFLKLSTPILNTLKMNVFFWTDLKQADIRIITQIDLNILKLN